MCDNDPEMRHLVESAAMSTKPDPKRTEIVRRKTLAIAGRAANAPRRRHTGLIAALVVLGVSGIGLAASETGRNFIRWIFTPVEELHSTEWVSPDGDVWSQTTTGRSEPYSPQEQEEVARKFAENYQSKQAGEGRLVGLIESPGWTGVSETTYRIEYTQSNGEKSTVGSGRPAGKQAENMRIDEIMRLRDAGAGEIVDQGPFPIGLGKYTIRFTLSDGQTVDLETFYPPGTRDEREQIFAEMRELKAALRFAVRSAYVYLANPETGVWGTLQYTLADGRVVGAAEQLPPEVISEDGTQVVIPGAEEPIAIQGASAEPE